eukprot:TRINITY_DN8845_c0_g1_i9.p2 TRINITY_DN8845_c0_g1~~TRINITY_DN8845_c0_g1_i9.p2  ORF type:complete len:101 (-),score=5.03 TRINITY_DN8845_c0_g1_i9:27-329(-)
MTTLRPSFCALTRELTAILFSASSTRLIFASSVQYSVMHSKRLSNSSLPSPVPCAFHALFSPPRPLNHSFATSSAELVPHRFYAFQLLYQLSLEGCAPRG